MKIANKAPKFPDKALVDSGPLVAYYNQKDAHHQQIEDFFRQCNSQLITTDACIGEVMYLLQKYASVQVQICFSQDVADGIWKREVLIDEDYKRIADLLDTYRDRPADFADLSLVVISERLNIQNIVSLDSDFNIYRQYQTEPFIRIFYPHVSKSCVS